MKAGTNKVAYVFRGKDMAQVKIPRETRDRVAKLAAANGVTIGFQMEQLLQKPLQEAEKTAAN